ncbi:hypothetical protein LXL04_028575 [Taraxacum kok-saghyz]
MFVSVWVDQHLNFGNRKSNRVESQHAKLKRYLESSNSKLDRFVQRIDEIVQLQLDYLPMTAIGNDDIEEPVIHIDDPLEKIKENYKEE